ncbi:PIN domain-like protein [Umbelopsis sp. AD052]|nr:PIN domain-like protein [Umbelopsis sp. AD052]
MGVRGLTPLLKRYAPRSLSSITAKDLTSSFLAVDASCHLNKFVHAAEPYAYPHISGFFALARFCTHHNITPIFVFDGSTRLKQKYLEQQRRAKVRSKVRYSLAFEQDRQRRLADWLSVIRSLTRDPSLPDVRKAIESMHEKGISMSGEEAAAIVLDIQHDSASTDKYPGGKQLQDKLLQIANELRDSLSLSSDNEKYTRTVRRLSDREQAIMDALIDDKLVKIKASLSDLSAENHNQLVSLEKRSVVITQKMKEECMNFLDALGYTCLVCDDHEAEAMCANLCASQITSATITEDLDALVFGDSPILRHFFAPNRPILRIDPIIARRELRLSKESFMDFCILCGTDFNSTIKGIGAVRALQYMQQYGSIEAMLPHLPKQYCPTENFFYKEAREVFQSAPVIPNITMRKPIDLNDAVDLLRNYEIDADEVEERLQIMSLHHNRSNQAGWGVDPFANTP